MLESDLDVIVIGTGLANSIVAGALSKAGCKVAHIDKNPYYGSNEASLSADELIQWADSNPPGISSISRSGAAVPSSRQYSISLAPSVLPSLGPQISSLISSGVSKYTGFKLLKNINVVDANGGIQPVPGNKEDVFKNKSISLIEKRRLMRFLTFASGPELETAQELGGKETMPFTQFLTEVFNLPLEMVSIIAYALAYCESATDATLPALQRIRTHLLSAGRYGPSSFLIGHYGGAGEIAQGFCRAAAVSGAIYILDKEIDEVHYDEATSLFAVTLPEFPDTLTCKIILAEESQLPTQLSARRLPETYPSRRCARGIVIIDTPLSFAGDGPRSIGEASDEEAAAVDTSILVFPPNSLSNQTWASSVTALVTGADTMSCPAGKWIVYLYTPLGEDQPVESAEALLRPYLDAVLARRLVPSSDPVKPLLSLFYVQNTLTHSANAANSDNRMKALITPPPSSVLPEMLDSAALVAEGVFREVITVVKQSQSDDEEIDFWPPIVDHEGDDDEVW
ncbi:rab escort protein, partial [Pterulicium gracile]